MRPRSDSDADPSKPPPPRLGVRPLDETARRRTDQRTLLSESVRTQCEITKERIRLLRQQIEELQAARADAAWIREQAGKMLADGWTVDELREVGFSDALLRSLSLPPRARTSGGDRSSRRKTE